MTDSFDIRNSAFRIFPARRLAIMNLAIRGIEADIGKEHADTFRNVQHPDLRADYVLANPPFNDSDTALRGSAFLQSEAKMQVVSEAKDNFRKDDDVRWQWSGATWTTEGCPEGERGGVHQFGVPPKGNANFAWVQHFIHHLAPQGMAGFVLANGSMSSNQSGEGDIRRALIEADLVDCMVALPGQLFYSVVKCLMPCRLIQWIKRSNIPGWFAELRSQGAHISAPLKTQMPFPAAIAAQLS